MTKEQKLILGAGVCSTKLLDRSTGDESLTMPHFQLARSELGVGTCSVNGFKISSHAIQGKYTS